MARLIVIAVILLGLLVGGTALTKLADPPSNVPESEALERGG
jgi:hypothetical protein